MISSMQPSRPRLPPQQTNAPPMNQQPARSLSSAQPPPNYATGTVFLPPRTQLEAMPPTMPPASFNLLQTARQAQIDAATRHPVFFTDKLRKAPMGVSAGGGTWTNPVANGYVFNDGLPRKNLDGGVKL